MSAELQVSDTFCQEQESADPVYSEKEFPAPVIFNPGRNSFSLEEELLALEGNPHLAIIYETEKEWALGITVFLKVALSKSAKCIYLFDLHSYEEVKNYLSDGKIDLELALDKGDLILTSVAELFPETRACEPDIMVEFLTSETQKALSQGYSSLWICCEKTCFYKMFSKTAQLLEFEAKLNQKVFSQYPCRALCQYPRDKFDSNMLKGVLLTHPYLILGHTLYRNFYYIPPEEFLNNKTEEIQLEQWLNNIKVFHHQFYFFQELMDAMPNPIFFKNLKGVFQNCNQAFAKYMNRSKEEIIGKTNFDFLPEELALQCSAMDQEIFQNPEPQSYEWQVSYNDGLVRNYLVNKAPFFTLEGDLIGLVGMIMDITERKQMEEKLKASEAKYRTLIENAQDGIFTLDPEGVLVDTNTAGLTLLGYSREEFLGKHIREFVMENLDNILQRIKFAQIGSKALVRTKLRKKDGSLIPVEVSAQRREDGFFQAFVRDLSERLRMEEELNKISRLDSLANLAAGIAHDFNNIIMAILGNLSLIKAKLEPESELYEELSEAEKACHRARDLTRQLSTFARGGAPIKEVTALTDLIKESAIFTLRGSKCRVEFEIAEGLWLVEVDPNQFSQVINNLVLNAKQAMPKGGIIKIKAENLILDNTSESSLPLSPGQYVKISIQDQGRGIPPEHLSKIFDPFFSTKDSGRGLGLATSYSIVRNHSGIIKVNSELGKGSVFEIYLPATDKELKKSPGKVEQTPLLKGKGTVLLMDDEEAVCKVAKRMIESLGYEVMVAKDGKEALDFYQVSKEAGKPFDIVIMDLTVPGGMGGEEAIKILREIDPEAKVIVSSGYSDRPIMSEYQKYGFQAVLTKPYELTRLSEVLRQFLPQEAQS